MKNKPHINIGKIVPKLDKTQIYLDLSKLSGEEIKEVEILSGDQIEEIHYWIYLFWNGSEWDQCEMSIVIDLELTEITLSQFRNLFSSGEEVLQGENFTREDMEKAYRAGENGATFYFKDTTVILPTSYEGVDG